MEADAASRWSDTVLLVWDAGRQVRSPFGGAPSRQVLTYLWKVFVWVLKGGPEPDPTKAAPEV